MYAFEYHRPKSVSDAAALLAKSQGKVLAGGQSLVGAMKLRLAQPGNVIDLGDIEELHGIKKDGNNIVIGATTRHAEVAASADVKKNIPALAVLAEGIGDRQVRNMGTIGARTSARSPLMISLKACTKRRCSPTRSSPP
jgi:carbon-monoxide dehydrogenase medium subunit